MNALIKEQGAKAGKAKSAAMKNKNCGLQYFDYNNSLLCAKCRTKQKVRLNPRTSECLQCQKVDKEIIHFCIA